MSKALKVTHIVGARPNFVKAAPLVKALEAKGVEQSLIHTGQHYDEIMSDAFFRDLNMPTPDFNLHVGGGTQFDQLSKLMLGLPDALTALAPDALILYGDVNSTMVASIVANRLDIAVIHVEAGLRSGDMRMPEESNRKIVDMFAELHLTTSPEALDNLVNEGANASSVHEIGNTMIDSLFASQHLFDFERIQVKLGVPEKFGVVTMHRGGNVDDPERVKEIVDSLTKAAAMTTLVLPLHPRGRQTLMDAGLDKVDNLVVCDPLGYTDFLSLVGKAQFVVTDSGGVQEETTVMGIPCLTLRPNTERPITITEGTNRLVTASNLSEQIAAVLSGDFEIKGPPALWDGKAAIRGADVIVDFLNNKKG
jgi:UDP-N-acetylglucosamine 2-epimerase (non-hydrolysing)